MDDYPKYFSIIDNRGQAPLQDINGYPFAMYALRQDYINGKIVWENNYKYDLLRYFSTNHSLLSIVFSPKYHPYQKAHRIIVCLSSLCLSVLFAALIITTSNQQSLFEYLKLAICSSAAISIFNCVTKFCLVCTFCDNYHEKLRCCFKIFGCMIAIYFQMLTAILYLMTGIALLAADNANTKHFWIVWIASTFASFIFEAIITYIFFQYGWNKEHKLQEHGLLKVVRKYYVTFNEYQSWMNGENINVSMNTSPPISSFDKFFDDRYECIVEQGKAKPDPYLFQKL